MSESVEALTQSLNDRIEKYKDKIEVANKEIWEEHTAIQQDVDKLIMAMQKRVSEVLNGTQKLTK